MPPSQESPKSQAPSPRPGEIHLWWVRLDPSDAAVESHRRVLDPAEHERAVRFRFERHRSRYIVSHGALRTLLGRYLGVAPHEVRFEFGERGKPRLESRHGSDLRFNLTHSRHRAAIGLRTGGEVGVDLEQVRFLKDLTNLARSVFSPRELEEVERAQDAAQREIFFVLWTRKEAFLKATGEGISTDLKRLDVMPRAHQDGGFEAVAGRDGISIATLRPRPGWIASVAIEGQKAHLLQFSFE